MSEKNPTLRDLWRLMGVMNRRFDGMNKRFDGIDKRFDALERAMVALKADVNTRIGALKESIEARDFRLDEHGRRLNQLENPR